MKNLLKIKIKVLTFLLFASVANSQEQPTEPAADCASCRDKKYSYYVCKDDKLDVECSNNPKAISGAKAIKKCLTNSDDFEYDNSNNPYPNGISCPDATGAIKKVFDGSETRMKEIIKKALGSWLGACNGNIDNSGCQECKLKVRWAVLPADFAKGNITFRNGQKQLIDSKTDIAFTSYPSSMVNCSVDCNQNQVWINGSSEFQKSRGGNVGVSPTDDDGCPYSFFYTERENKGVISSKNPTTDPNKYDYRDLCTIVTHEVGHWLGFAHANRQGGSVVDPTTKYITRYNFECDNRKVLRGVMQDGVSGKFDDSLQVSEDDKCRFMKLYCCPVNSVNDNEKNSALILITPNPSYGKFKLSLQKNMPVSIIEIYDLKGKLLLSQKGEASKAEYNLDLTPFASGQYTISLKYKSGEVYNKQIIIKR